MANNVLVKTLLRSVMPTVTKFVDGGKIDELLRELKSRYASHADQTAGESVEIMLTTEADGNEYANIIVLGPDLSVRSVVEQQRLSELITALFNQVEL